MAVTTSEKLLMDWVRWYDSGEPRYKAPAGMTARHLAQVRARETGGVDKPVHGLDLGKEVAS